MEKQQGRGDMATAASPGPAGSCHNFRTGCSTGSTGSGSGNTAATAERTAKKKVTDKCINFITKSK